MKQPISLVLSSGGARGIAHIGVIEMIEIGRFVTKKSLKKYQQQNSLI